MALNSWPSLVRKKAQMATAKAAITRKVTTGIRTKRPAWICQSPSRAPFNLNRSMVLRRPGPVEILSRGLSKGIRVPTKNRNTNW